MLENDFCTDQAWRKTDAAGVCKDMVYGSITASNPRTAFSEGQYFEGGWNLASDYIWSWLLLNMSIALLGLVSFDFH